MKTVSRFSILLSVVTTASVFAQPIGRPTPPPLPAVAPIVSAPKEVDKDRDGVDDRITSAISSAKAVSGRWDATTSEVAAANTTLDEKVDVELIFDRQITQQQIDAFLDAGGEITRVFTNVSYGWTGRIARKNAARLPGLMGKSLLGVVGKTKAILHMDEAARTGRVRPDVWNLGVNGISSGGSRITVAILDTGVDGSHTDLNGRQVYWKDWTADNHLSSQDKGHHGSHVAGIAVGTGAASGVSPSTLSYMDFGNMPTTAGSFYPSPIRIPSSLSSFTWNSTMIWQSGAGKKAELGHIYVTPADTYGLISATTSGNSSPLAESNTPANPYTGGSDRFTSYATKQSGGGAPEYAVTNTVGYAGVGDGYNTLSGVAPDCSWAGFKVFTDDGGGSSVDIDEALDDLVAQRSTNNIKVANMSLGYDGAYTPTRNKTNTAAMNGVVVCVSAGNSGDVSAGAAGEVGDPGRAHYCITVASSSDINQLTDYSSHGFAAPGDASTGDEDMKPDIMAPGGSTGHQTNIMSIDSNSGDSWDTTGANYPDQVANNYMNIQGTSMASPFLAGCAALVIEALQQSGETWDFSGPAALDDVLRVKMLLTMTATETTAVREAGPSGNPTLNRGAKDINEGYGIVNTDAAVELLVNSIYPVGPFSASGLLGSGRFEKRCWARRVSLAAGNSVNLTMTVPAVGDYDLYLYSATPNIYGNPVILASSVNAGAGVSENINYAIPSTQVAYLVVKRVSGGGLGVGNSWNISGTLGGTDSTAPTVSSVSAQTQRTINVTFSEPMGAGVTTAANYTITGAGIGTLSLNPDSVALSSGNTYTLTWNSPKEMLNGSPVTVTVANVSDLASNAIGIPNSGATTGIGVAPTVVSVNRTNATPTNSSSLSFTVIFSEAVTGVAASNFAKAGALAGSGTIGTPTTSDNITWTVVVSGVSGNGTLGLNLNSGAGVADAAGNPLSNTATGQLYTVDQTAPTATVTGPASPTNTSPINFTISFSESVAGLTVGEITVTGGTKGTLTGSGPYTLPVTPTGQGAVTCQVIADAAQDGAGNGNTVSNNLSITYDSAGPSATVTGPASPTNTSPINFVINFSESVTGLTAAEITVTNGTKGALTGSGSGPYTIPITPTAQGAVTCQVIAGAAQDGANNGNTISNNLSITYDTAGPTATVTGPASPTNLSPINFTINFSESVTGLTAAEITVTGGTKGALTGSGTGPYTMPVTPTADGAVTCQVTAGAAQDAASNSNTISNNLSITYDSVGPSATVTGPASPTSVSPINFTINFSESVTGLTAAEITVTNGTKGALTGSGSGPYTIPVTPTAQGAVTCQVIANAAQDSATNGNTVSNNLSITYDNVGPTATVTGPTSPTSASPINFTINFSESVTGLTAAEITVTNGTKGALSGSGSGPYTMPVTPTAQGAVTCQVIAGAAQDGANNGNMISNNLSITYDTAGPTATVTGPASPTNLSPINFTINFSESVTGLTAAEITVTGGTKGTLTGSGSGPYTMPVAPTADGAVTCQVTAGAAQDAASNNNTVSNNLSITYDSGVPTATVTGPASPTSASPINFVINFSESVTGLTAAEITVTNGAKGVLTGSGSGPYTLPVTPGGQGAVTCQVIANAAQDAATNGNTISNNLSITYDTAGPTATVTGPTSPTSASPINFTINFSESVAGLTAAEITVTNGTKGALSGSGSGPYTIPVTPTAQGAVTCQVIAGAAQDGANNGNTISNNLSITYDSVVPSATVTGPASPTNSSPINFTINFSESVTGLTAAEITVTGGTKGTLTGTGSGPYTMPITPTADGAVTCQVIADAAQDGATNGNTISNNLSITYDSAGPTASVTGPASPTNANPINFTINFSESVTGLTAAEITVTGGAKGVLSGTGSGPYTLPVTPSGQGAVTCQVTAGAAQDSASNSNTVSNNLSITFDSVGPTATVTGPISPTNVSPINFTINFSESVTGLTAGEITVSGGAKGSLSGTGSGPYTMPVTPSGQGAVTCQVVAAAAQDTAGNNNTVSNNLSVTYDSMAPTVVSINRASASPTNASSLSFTVTFSEAVSGVTASNFVKSGSLSGVETIGTPSTVDNISWTISVSPVAGSGTLGLNLNSASGVTDAAFNSLSNTLAGQQYTVDQAVPTVTVTGPASPTNSNPINFTINFSESVTGLTAGEITVTGGSKGSLTGSGSGPYTMPVTPAGQGTVTCLVTASAAQDSVSNNNTASNNLSVEFDSVAPTISLSTTAPSLTNTSPVPVTVTLSETSGNFVAAAVAPVNCSVANLGGTGVSYTFELNPSGQGLLSAQVGAGTFTDAAGNSNTPSNILSRTFDTIGPTVFSVTPVSFNTVDVTFTEANAMAVDVTSASLYTITGSGKGSVGSNPTSVVLQSGSTYRLAWSSGNMINGQPITIAVQNGATGVHDAAGNPLGVPSSGGTTALPVGVAHFALE